MKTASLDQLIALNDEVAALVRAGVPLDQGLVEVGRDLPGRSGAMMTQLGARIRAGESLPQILTQEAGPFPPIWRAVVAAGLRSGRLSVALEGLATTGRRIAELRRAIGVAAIYPLVLVTLAYAVFVYLLTCVVPTINRAFEDLTAKHDRLLAGMAWLGQAPSGWPVWVPLVAVFVLAIGWWQMSRRMGQPGVAAHRTGWRSGSHGFNLSRAGAEGRLATFAETLALLIEQRVPLPEGLVLAADASGDARLSRGARDVAARLQRGERVEGKDALPKEFPPLVGWMILTGAHQPGFPQTLRITADGYRQRAVRSTRWIVLYLPILLTVVFGGTATLINALATFAPMIRLLYTLAQP